MADVQDTQQSIEFDIRSCLPRCAPEQVRQQIQHIVSQGWNLAVEHVEPERSFKPHWYLWKLSKSSEQSVERSYSELEACHREHPGHHIRLIGYDDYARSQNTAFVVYRGV